MDARDRAVAEDCLAAAYDDRMDFPAIVGRLIEGGFEGYLVDYRHHSATYYRPDGDSALFATQPLEAPVAPVFDAAAVAAAVREAQTKAPGYSYRGFSAKVARAGCAGYLVSFPGRRVVYFGRTAEMHVEHFPS
jgi:uncharacterized protein YbcV (DUF1398 family)